MSSPLVLSQNAPIGIFDSGVGGLSVLREVQRQLPQESVYYLADTANVPYGDKPLSVVRDLALKLTCHLIQSGAKAVIMASGTSTVAGLTAARVRFPQVPIFGVIDPGARAAIAASNRSIGVIATNATAHSLAFTQAIQAIDPIRTVIEIGCPRFVPLVESGQTQSLEALDACRAYLRPLAEAQVDTIILGCTHFPFLIDALNHAASDLPEFKGALPRFIDPARETVQDIIPILVPSDNHVPGRIHFAATNHPEDFAKYASGLLHYPVRDVSPLTL